MYSGPSGVLFVEYKYVPKLPKKATTNIRHTLSPLQLQWLERMKTSANAALVVGVEDSCIILVDDFATNICKTRYLEEKQSRKEAANFIYQTTHGTPP